eukprot:6471264-Amphidinium_carterae.4
MRAKVKDMPRWSASNEMRGVNSQRARDLIDLACQMQDKEDWGSSKFLTIDYSQSAERKPWSHSSCKSLVCASSLFICSRDRIAHPVEHAAMLGFDIKTMNFEGLSWSEIRDLTGDAMAAPTVGVVALAFLCAQQTHSV